jgi:hypothetical protein
MSKASLFTAIRTEGVLLPADLLQHIAAGASGGADLADTVLHTSAQDYLLAPGERINEAIARSWARLRGLWPAFRRALEEDGTAAATATTRERWLFPLLDELRHGRPAAVTGGLTFDNKSYPLSHRAGDVPLHLVGARVELDRRTPGVAGAAGMAPHALVQELLNRAPDMLWGIVSNGLRLRLLRDNAALTRPAYVEFDLQSIFDGERYAEFALLWLTCHASRFAGGPSILERWMRSAHDRGTRALDALRDGVQRTIESLGAGFLSHPANIPLRESLRSGALSTQDYYREVLRWVYRMVFLCVAEERELLNPHPLHPLPSARGGGRGVGSDAYHRFYSMAALRRIAGRIPGDRHSDRFEALRLVCRLLGEGGGEPLALPHLGGFLFSQQATPHTTGCAIDNRRLFDAVRALAWTRTSGVRRAVDFEHLGAEELGGVYESLLELKPELNPAQGTFRLAVVAGSERKTTGSYYTRSDLVDALLDSALEPVLAPRRTEAQILALRVCDAACGSGHFLIAAAHRITKKLARLRAETAGDVLPSPDTYRAALREVIAHCIYGVDLNPMSVELCKVNLWLESMQPGKPLGFLDHHIQTGNSLLGTTPELIEAGVPDEAFEPIAGDDKKYCAEWKKANRKFRGGRQGALFTQDMQPWERLGDLPASMAQLDAMPEDDATAVARKSDAYATAVRSASYENARLRADAWCAAFVWKKCAPEAGGWAYPITSQTLAEITHNPHSAAPWLRAEVQRLAAEYRFFHWHLAFPEVFAASGFDVMLGNPPWERIKLQEKEWFAARAPEIAQARNAAERKRMIEALQASDPALFAAFRADARRAEGESHFVRSSGAFELTAVGDVNTYALFAELNRTLLAATGRAGVIVPTGIATDDGTKDFFGDLVARRALASLFDFENRQGLFPAVDSRMKFCLLTLSGRPIDEAQFAFFAAAVDDLKDAQRRFTLTPEDIARVNPNTRTVPIFRTRADADLTRANYRRVPVLVSHPHPPPPAGEGAGGGEWGITFSSMFHMSNDSGLFRSAPGPELLPLYEAKLLHQFDHRWATYDGESARDATDAEHADPHFAVTPRYWVSRAEVEARLQGRWEREWLIGFRRFGPSTNERSFIANIQPMSGYGDSIFLLFPEDQSAIKSACFLGCLNAMVLDWIVRQKVGGTNINFFYVKQFPILPPSAYSEADIDYIVPRVVELVCTADDIAAFGRDVRAEAGEERWEKWQKGRGERREERGELSTLSSSLSTSPLFPFLPTRRARLRAELDARYARLYGLSTDELRYILDPQDVMGADFPGETFRVLKDREMREFGEYRTKRLVLEAWGKEGE